MNFWSTDHVKRLSTAVLLDNLIEMSRQIERVTSDENRARCLSNVIVIRNELANRA